MTECCHFMTGLPVLQHTALHAVVFQHLAAMEHPAVSCPAIGPCKHTSKLIAALRHKLLLLQQIKTQALCQDKDPEAIAHNISAAWFCRQGVYWTRETCLKYASEKRLLRSPYCLSKMSESVVVSRPHLPM